MFSVKTALWGRPRGMYSRKFETNTEPLVKKHENIEYVPQNKENPKHYLKDLLSDHDNGDFIVYTLYKSKTYRTAILKIEKVVGKRWIYDRAIKLKYVYDTLHSRKAS
jgi:hypothetical protein